MAKCTAVLLLAASAQAATQRSASRAQVSPVGKIVEMLGSMKAKTESDLAAEKKSFEEFMNYCDDEAKAKDYAIKTGNRQIQDLKANIEEANAEASGLADDIQEIGQVISGKEEELAKATKLRGEAVANFQATEAELMNSLQELSEASTHVAKGDASSLLQADVSADSDRLDKIVSALSKVVDSALLAEPDRQQLSSFLQSSDSDEASNIGGVAQVLEDTRDKADKQLSDCRKAETKAQQEFELMRQGLENEIKTQKEKLAEATNRKAACEETASMSSGDLGEAEKTKAADSEFLDSLRIDCQQKAVEWEQRMRSGKGEIEAIEKATEILEKGVRASFLQVSARTLRASARAGLRLRSGAGLRMHARMHSRMHAKRRGIRDPFADDDDEDSSNDDEKNDGDDDGDDGGDSLAQANARMKVVSQLKDLGEYYHSFLLTQISNRARADPMAKVKTLIEEMIAKLMQEAAEEATGKAFCDAEIGKSKKAQEEKGGKLRKVTARLDEASSTKSELEVEIKELEASIAEIDKGQQEATKIRTEEKAEFKQTQSDLTSSEEACAQAVAVLKSYYDNASFLQVSSSSRRASSRLRDTASDSGPEAGAQIIDFLMMAEEDFAKQLAEVETDEAKDAAAYEKLSNENKLAKATKQMEVKGKTSETKSLQVTIDDHSEDKSSLEKELQAVDMYLEKLKPQCETKTDTPEEKAAARKAEIEGLKDALSVLEG
jgi:hypothetical protein